jgi:DNA-binding response OmpR family regulator
MRPTLLIVDDSTALHQMVCSCLAGEPWHVCSAYTGVAGLSLAAARSPEVVLLDLDLPDLNGFDVCRHMWNEGSESAVIFLTASDSPDARAFGMYLGAVDFLTKPFHPSELLGVVRRSIGDHRRIGPVPSDLAAPRGRKLRWGTAGRHHPKTSGSSPAQDAWAA